MTKIDPLPVYILSLVDKSASSLIFCTKKENNWQKDKHDFETAVGLYIQGEYISGTINES